MASSQMWDVNKYKSEFESEEHWQLRKRFMETHMDKFPEDKLVCLARVFFNVEFLGCRYPEKTMRMIAELSQGVADEHREKQKGKLKRTFVQASDAAGSKIKGSSTQVVEPQTKIVKTNQGSFDYCSDHIKFTNPLSYPSESEEFPGLILFENCNINGQVETCPINILNQSVQKSGYNIKIVTNGRMCEIKLNDKLLVSDEAPTAKEAKLNAAIKGLRKLRKTCYTIQVKRAYYSSGPSITKDKNVTETEIRLPQDNIGSKMMLKMGWSGSGLGKSQQGIEDPVKAAPQIMNRAGFGCANQKDLESQFTKVFKDHIRSDSESDLVFSPDFTAEERKILHRNQAQPEIRVDYDSDDLFGSDSEKDCEVDVHVEHTSNSKLSKEKSCFICSKLRFVTGEETDNDIYDTVWNTGYKTNDIMLINDHSDCEFGRTETFSSKTEEDLTLESIENNERLDVLVEQTKPAPSDDVNIEEEPALERLKIFLPDGSYKRIVFKEMLANKELREFTKYSVGKTNMSYRHFATIEDLKTNSALRELFSDFLLSSKPLGTQYKTPEKLKEMSVLTVTSVDHKYEAGSSHAHSNANITLEDVSDTLQSGIQPSNNEIFYKYWAKVSIEGNIMGHLIQDVESRLTHINLNDIGVKYSASETLHNHSTRTQNYTPNLGIKHTPSDLTRRRRPKIRRIKIILPNGSFQRLAVKNIESNKELKDIFSRTKVLTDTHFINHRIIRETFSKYWATINNEQGNRIASETSLIGSRENNIAACTTSTNIAIEEREVKSINHPIWKLSVNEHECVNSDKYRTHQTATEHECVNNDKSRTHQTATENEYVNIDKSRTPQTATENECVNIDKSGIHQTARENERVNNDKSRTHQTTTENEWSTTNQSPTGIDCVCLSSAEDASDNKTKLDSICSSGILTNNEIVYTPIAPQSNKKRKRNRRKKIKFYLPDGSFERVLLDDALKCKELIEFVSNREKRHIPVEILKTENVSRLFSKYLSKPVVDDINKNQEV